MKFRLCKAATSAASSGALNLSALIFCHNLKKKTHTKKSKGKKKKKRERVEFKLPQKEAEPTAGEGASGRSTLIKWGGKKTQPKQKRGEIVSYRGQHKTAQKKWI